MALPVIYLARHAETVFNRGARMQGWHAHTPLTRAGFVQAQAMGEALRAHLGVRPDISFWASSAGRAQQTAAIIADHLEHDFFSIRLDDRLQEIHIGDWYGQSYAEVMAAQGDIIDPVRRIFSVKPPGGEWYDDIARRMQHWLDDIADAPRPQLAISHGISARVLRGLLVGGADYHGIAIADDLPQGTLMRIENGVETPIITGSGSAGEHRTNY